MAGWQEDITNCTSYDELPYQLKDVTFIENYLETPVRLVSVDPIVNKRFFDRFGACSIVLTLSKYSHCILFLLLTLAMT